jgi:hypothetical protein
MDEALIRTKIIEHLEAVRPRGHPVVPISDNTELWYDLGIYGDELFDFALWARDALGIEPKPDEPEPKRVYASPTIDRICRGCDDQRA